MSIIQKNSTRRSFLQASAAATAAAALGVVGCSETKTGQNEESSQDSQTDIENLTPHTVDSDSAIIEHVGQWVPMRCHNNCNGTCVNMGYVVDGVIVRQKTDDTGDDALGHFQQRGCPKGRSQRQEIYNVDRLKYPMKRKNWAPGGGENSHGELRGRDEWERISWDEALDLVASELERVYRDYGPTSVLANGWRYSRDGANFLYSLGGCVTLSDTESFGTYAFRPELLGMNVVWTDHPDIQRANDRYDMKNADYIVLYGSNPAWSQMSMAPYLFKLAQEEGVKFITVSSSRNITGHMYNADWVPVRPGTDTAFLLAVMYEMMRLDEEEGNIVDWEFLKKYTVGFTLDNMPEDARLQECISEYVKGVYDGIPKTPEWASEICGTPIEQITEFARICGKQNNTMLLHSYAPSRCNGAENFPQAFLTVGAMGGHMGKSGNACAVAYSFDIADSGEWLFQSVDGVRDRGWLGNPLGDNANIEGPSWWNAMLEGKYISTNAVNHNGNTDLSVTFHEAKEMPVNPKILFAYYNNFMQSRQDANNAIKAMRSVELAVGMDIKTSITMQFCDIIFPIMTQYEANDDPSFGPVVWPTLRTAYRKDTLIAAMPLIKPLYEARTDEYVFRELLSRLGKDPDELFDVSNKTFFFDHFINAEYVHEDGKTWSKILTWTEEDSKKYGVDNAPQKGEMTFDEFLQSGKFQIERHEGDGYTYIGYKDFIDDPEGHPLPSKSGKWELYCQLKADNYNVQGLNPEPIKPYANYIKPIAGYEESFTDWENKVKGPYPLQLYNVHYIRRAHTRLDNLAWLQEAFVNPVFLNAEDAAERGISEGDTVLVKSAYGKTLRKAALWNSVMPGVVALPHGPHSLFDEESDPDGDVIDRGGGEQILYGPVHSNYFHQLDGYNTVLVEVEKYDGEQLVEDYEREPFLAGAGEAE